MNSKTAEGHGRKLPPKLMNLREASVLLSTSPKTVERLIESGDIEAVQVGRQRKPVEDSVIAYYNRNKVVPSRQAAEPVRRRPRSTGRLPFHEGRSTNE